MRASFEVLEHWYKWRIIVLEREHPWTRGKHGKQGVMVGLVGFFFLMDSFDFCKNKFLHEHSLKQIKSWYYIWNFRFLLTQISIAYTFILCKSIYMYSLISNTKIPRLRGLTFDNDFYFVFLARRTDLNVTVSENNFISVRKMLNKLFN